MESRAGAYTAKRAVRDHPDGAPANGAAIAA
jgi:hypothetical protein